MGDNWELPKPVFRTTSGSLPQDFPSRAGVQAYPQAEAVAPNEGDQILSSLYAPPEKNVEEPIAPEPPTPSPAVVDIEPQPLISEQFSAEEVDPPVPEKPAKKSGSGSAILLVGIAVLLAIVVGILAVAYVLFFRSPPDPTF